MHGFHGLHGLLGLHGLHGAPGLHGFEKATHQPKPLEATKCPLGAWPPSRPAAAGQLPTRQAAQPPGCFVALALPLAGSQFFQHVCARQRRGLVLGPMGQRSPAGMPWGCKHFNLAATPSNGVVVGPPSHGHAGGAALGVPLACIAATRAVQPSSPAARPRRAPGGWHDAHSSIDVGCHWHGEVSPPFFETIMGTPCTT